MLSAVEVLPVLAVCTDVHSSGGRGDGHPGMPIDVRRGSAPLRAGPAALQLPLAGRARLRPTSGTQRPQQPLYRPSAGDGRRPGGAHGHRRNRAAVQSRLGEAAGRVPRRKGTARDQAATAPAAHYAVRGRETRPAVRRQIRGHNQPERLISHLCGEMWRRRSVPSVGQGLHGDMDDRLGRAVPRLQSVRGHHIRRRNIPVSDTPHKLNSVLSLIKCTQNNFLISLSANSVNFCFNVISVCK